MESNISAEQKNADYQKNELERNISTGASWFTAIGVMSIINTLIYFMGGNLNFVIGLGITLIIDGFTFEAGTFGMLIGLVLNALIAGTFVVFGIFAKRKSKWAFITGMILYGLDGLVFLFVKDFVGIGFHIFALMFIIKGSRALREYLKLVNSSLSNSKIVFSENIDKIETDIE